MNQQVVDYLRTNKDSYTKESLVEQLKNSGYSDSEIQEGLNMVYGNADNSIPIPQAVNTDNQAPQEEKRSIWKIVLIVGGIIFAVGFVIVLILGSIVMVSLNSARDKARDASAKSTISSTVPTAILCMDDGNDLTNPVPGTLICEDALGSWPEFGVTGQWGIMIDDDVSDGTFAYTAAYGVSGEATCTEAGCIFSD